jgi:tRNA modification GTPase
MKTDTIAALSTPLGESGIAIVRLSGPRALAIADTIFIAGEKTKSPPSRFPSHTIHYGWVVCGARKSKKIDEVLLTVMKRPRTYTREDIVEINCHGGTLVAQKTLTLCVKKGARLAEPGEFTKRAFLNGRLDLAQAEAVLEIIRARSEKSLDLAARQLEGSLSGRIHDIKEEIASLRALFELQIDFSDQGIAIEKKSVLAQRLRRLRARLESLIALAAQSRMLKEGFKVVICGKPNVGKSSIMNALLKRQRVIVSPYPGTTRDAVEDMFHIKGVAVRLVDTAGIRKRRSGVIEVESNAHTTMHVQDAHLVLFVIDASRDLSYNDIKIARELKSGPREAIVVMNKIDVPSRVRIAPIKEIMPRAAYVKVSALTGKNISALYEALHARLTRGIIARYAREHVMINARHKECLQGCLAAVTRAADNLARKGAGELIAQDLREAGSSIDTLLGARAEGEVIDRIFRDFCIGK